MEKAENGNIPTYHLENLSKDQNDIFLIINNQLKNPTSSVNIPFRSNYYGVGLCTEGKAELKANLESYFVEPGCIVAMSPHIIKQWIYMSDDFKNSVVFFTGDFIISSNNISLDSFPFFESVAEHAFCLSPAQIETVDESLNFLYRKYLGARDYKNEILKNLIYFFLFEIASIYAQRNSVSNHIPTRSQQLTTDFKKLVSIHFAAERSVKFYAKKLFVTGNHLTESVKEVTGKTAGQWIDEMVILEAKVLLHNPALNIGEISDSLNFADQSTFGKFFKNITKLSPLAYRQKL